MKSENRKDQKWKRDQKRIEKEMEKLVKWKM